MKDALKGKVLENANGCKDILKQVFGFTFAKFLEGLNSKLQKLIDCEVILSEQFEDLNKEIKLAWESLLVYYKGRVEYVKNIEDWIIPKQRNGLNLWIKQQ